jgi:ABC-2 type transport system permease protein
VRGILVGTIVLLTSLFFTHLSLTITNLLVVLAFAILTAIIFSLAGLVNGIYAKSIDGINIVPTFVLTPLVYLGGVFYSITTLPYLVQVLSHFNPVFYLINGFRYGFLGISDVSLATATEVLVALGVVLIGINWYLLKKGLGLKQ